MKTCSITLLSLMTSVDAHFLQTAGKVGPVAIQISESNNFEAGYESVSLSTTYYY